MFQPMIGSGWALPLASRKGSVMPDGKLIPLANGEVELEQAMGIILMTALGERVMRPEFGCRIHELVFAPNDRETAVLAERYVQEALGRWEPRVVIDNVQAEPASIGNNGRFADEATAPATLLIHIQYTIKASNDERSLVYPFYLIPGEGS